MVSDKEGLEWLENKLKTQSPYFYQSELYKILKNYLSKYGYWRAKPRGNPSKAYEIMVSKLY